MEPVEHSDQQHETRPAAERWRRLPPRILPEDWTETTPVTTPHEAPVVLGNGVAYRGGVPLPD
jgi:hypothetical protein